jgi:hypothetical protein
MKSERRSKVSGEISGRRPRPIVALARCFVTVTNHHGGGKIPERSKKSEKQPHAQ